MIPKRIFTHWLNTGPMPDLVKKCIETQKIPGYEHTIVTLENCYRGSQYVNDALAAGQWVKASDWLRIHNIWAEGGIYLDGDMSVLPGKNFDHLLQHRLFLSREAGGYWANASLGSEAGHPLLKRYLDRVENNFRGSGDDVFSPGIRLFTDVFWEALRSWQKPEANWQAEQAKCNELGVYECPVEWFFPYNHLTKQTNVTPETIVYHHYMRSWGLPKDPPQPAPNEYRFYCTYHLGDHIFILWFLNTCARLWPHLRFSFYVEPRYFKEIQPLAAKFPNLEVTSVYNNHTQIEWWLGDWGLNRRCPDSQFFVDSMMRLQELIASKFDLPPWPQLSRQDMLLPESCLDSNHPLAGQQFDVLFVNSQPLSSQCVNYDADALNQVARDLINEGWSVCVTHPCGLVVPTTTELGMTLAQIAELATRCRVVAGVANAPFLATFNQAAFKTVAKWINYAMDRVFFDERVVGCLTLEDFRAALQKDRADALASAHRPPLPPS